MCSAYRFTASPIRSPDHRRIKTSDRDLHVLSRPRGAVCSMYGSRAASIRSISSHSNGRVGRCETLGFLSLRAKFWSTHPLSKQKLRNARNLSNFFPLESGFSRHVSRKSPSVATSNCRRRSKSLSLAKARISRASSWYFRIVDALKRRAWRSEMKDSMASSSAIGSEGGAAHRLPAASHPLTIPQIIRRRRIVSKRLITWIKK